MNDVDRGKGETPTEPQPRVWSEAQGASNDVRKVIANSLTNPRVPETTWQDSFEVEGSFYLGKASAYDDFDFHDKRGKFQTESWASGKGEDHGTKAGNVMHATLNSRIKYLCLYENEGNDRVAYINHFEHRSDAAGRPCSNVIGVRTRGDVHPIAYLLTLNFMELGNVLSKNYPAIGSHVQIDDLGRKVSTKNDHLSEALINRTANRAFATYILGEIAFLSPQGMRSVCKKVECMRHVSPVALLVGNDQESVIDVFKRNNSWNSRGIFTGDKDRAEHLSPDVRASLDLVEDRFGDNDAHFELLLSSKATDNEKKELLAALCSGTIGNVERVSRELFPWIEAVGTADEISKVKSKLID